MYQDLLFNLDRNIYRHRILWVSSTISEALSLRRLWYVEARNEYIQSLSEKMIVEVRMLLIFIGHLPFTSCLSVHEAILILRITTLYNLR